MPIQCSKIQKTRRARHYYAPKARSEEDQRYIDECEHLWIEARKILGRCKKILTEYEDRPHLVIVKLTEVLDGVLVNVNEDFEPEQFNGN